jgi:autotransporter-associated beta strand protein
VIDLTDAMIEVAVLAGEPEIGDTYTLFNLSGGTTLTGNPAGVTLPPNITWDSSSLLTSGTITVIDVDFKNGTWITDGDGIWTDPANWQGGTISNGPGKTAFFTAEFTEDTRVVSLNGENRSIGHLVFTDGETSSNDLTISGDTLTLQASTGTPTIIVTQSNRTLRIGSSISASQGLIKAGPGTFQPTQATNPSLTGSIRIDDGILLMSNPAIVGNVASIILNGGAFRVSPGANVNTNRPFEITANVGRLSKGSTANMGFNGAFTVSGSGNRTLTLENTGTGTGAGSNNTALSDPAEGTLAIRKTGSLGWNLNAANTYTGDTTVEAGTLTLGTNGALAFVIGANGINNQVTGTATLTLNGKLVIDLSTAGTSVGNTWTIIDRASLTTVTYGGTFKVESTTAAFTKSGSDWTITENGATYQFSQTSGLLTVIAGGGSPYESWAAQITNGLDLRTDDADADGFTNLHEFLFGTSPIAGNGALVTATAGGGNLVLRWLQRESGASYTLKQSDSLAAGFWSPVVSPLPAPDPEQSGAPVDYDYFTVTLPTSSGKLFFRIEGQEN